MNLQKAFSSSIGSKFLIALTGLFLVIFLVAHLAGNLLFIAGPDTFNQYSHALVSNPLVYVAELGLVAIFALHIFKTVCVVCRQLCRPADSAMPRRSGRRPRTRPAARAWRRQR